MNSNLSQSIAESPITRAEVIASLVDLLRPYLPLQTRLNVSDAAMLRAADHYLTADVAADHRAKYDAATS